MSSTRRTEIFIEILTLGLGLLVHFVLATEYNRVLIFKGPIEGKMLPGQVIRTEKVANEGSCRVRCFLEPNCVSINVGPAGDQGRRTCELKNFTDESPSQTGLQEATGHIHYSAENICHSNPCPGENFICQVGFTAKRYRCVCRDGFKGENCDEEINECSLDKGCGVSEYPPTVSSASKALDTSTASSSATQPADVSSSEATLIPTAVSTAYPASTTQPPQQDVSSSEATVIPTAVSTALPASTSQPPPLDVSSSEPAVIPTAVSTTSRTSTNKPSQQACQQGWIGHGTSCYKLVTPSKTWENAKRECENRNAKLVKVESREENDFIKTLLLPTDKDVNHWIGLSDSDSEGDWMWTDGTHLDSDGYKNWGDNRPQKKTNNDEDCVVIRIKKSDPDHYGKWHDRPCSLQRKYICEK